MRRGGSVLRLRVSAAPANRLWLNSLHPSGESKAFTWTTFNSKDRTGKPVISPPAFSSFANQIIILSDSREEVKVRVGEWVNKNNEKGWVVDGNHKSSALMSQCDLILLLDLPFFTVTFWRLLRRTIGRIITKEKLFGNNVEG